MKKLEVVALPRLIAQAKNIEQQFNELHEILNRIAANGLPRFNFAGIPRLTKQEKIILDLVNRGKTIEQIARQLKLSKRTIEAHKYNMSKKLKASH